MSCSRVRVRDWDSWFLWATRQGPGSHLTLHCNNHPCAPMVCLPWSLAKSILVQVPDRQPWPRNDASPALGRRFLCSGLSPIKGSPGQQLAVPGSHPGLALAPGASCLALEQIRVQASSLHPTLSHFWKAAFQIDAFVYFKEL